MNKLDQLVNQYLETEGLPKGNAPAQPSPAPQIDREKLYKQIAEHDAAILQNTNPYYCDTCKGFGQCLTADGWRYCTANCVNAFNLRRRNLLNVLKGFGDIPDIYADFTFQTWIDQVPANRRAKKEVAYMVMKYLVKHGGKEFALADVLNSDIPAEIVKNLSTEIVAPNLASKNEIDHYEKIQVLFGGKLAFTLSNSVGHSVVLASERKGMGKTGLCVAAAHELIDNGVAVAFLHLPTFLKDIRHTYGENATKSLDDVIAPVDRADVLFVDDFGVPQDASRHDIQVIEDHIIQPRWSKQRPTIITTNHTQTSFEKQWGERAASRVFEMAHWVELGGDIVRRKNQPVG